MKLIIDIDENLYNYISKEDAVYFPDDGGNLFEAVKNGTPLPKGHGDLIDREQILQGEHFVTLCDVQVGDENFGKHEIDMFPRQTIMSVKPIIEADKENKE